MGWPNTILQFDRFVIVFRIQEQPNGLLMCSCNIPSWRVVVLHIFVRHSPTPMCKTTPQRKNYLGNITVEERYEQHSYMLPR